MESKKKDWYFPCTTRLIGWMWPESCMLVPRRGRIIWKYESINCSKWRICKRWHFQVAEDSTKFILKKHWLFFYISISTTGKVYFEFSCPGYSVHTSSNKASNISLYLFRSVIFENNEFPKRFARANASLTFTPGSSIHILSATGHKPFVVSFIIQAMIHKDESKSFVEALLEARHIVVHCFRVTFSDWPLLAHLWHRNATET